MFSASHRLHSDEMSEEENRAPTASAIIPTDTDTTTWSRSPSAARSMSRPAWSAIWSIWMAFVHAQILERYDHQNLNLLSEFAKDVPTTENLCIAIYEIVKRGFSKAHLEKIRIEETMMNSFEYAGENSR
jgi:6-pyruvoyltetrahydropterin/6-carboxytetrahydropterin synthase